MYELALFAGAGGGILGGKLCGFDIIGAVEIEEFPREVLKQRQRDGVLPNFPIWDDVQTFRIDNPETSKYIETLQTIKDELIISGGFPCQDISSAGKGAGIEQGTRSGMWFEMARIIDEIRPARVLVENSPMLTSRGLGIVLGDLAKMGYDARWGVLGACDVGAPHQRERIWIVANSNRTQCKRAGFTIGSNTKHSHFNAYGPWWKQDPTQEVKSRMGRMANGVANCNHRLKAIGNGQVPAVVKAAWELLK